ncbi:MAG: tail fiber protein [Rhodospirillales bacterium]|nr:tail fiber protein [Rhodospirillales bacterium]
MDIYASNWNEDDNANNAAAPDGAPEGMAPSGVNNVLRAHQGAMKRFAVWSIPKTTGGSSTAYTLSYSVAPGALVDGMSFMVEFHVAPGAGATFNVNGLGAIPIRHFYNGTWYQLPPNWCAAGSILRLIYHASSGVFRVADSVQAIPTGTSQVNRSPSTPAGWLFEDGSAISRTQYPALFAALGNTYGAGDGSTTFNLPDSRGYVDASIGGPLGGSLAQKLGGTTNAAGVSVSVSGSVSGTLSGGTTAPVSGQGNAQGGGQGQASDWSHVHNVTVSGSLGGSMSGGGSTGAFSVVQPTLVGSKIIRT